jgi:hypothetical protein
MAVPISLENGTNTVINVDKKTYYLKGQCKKLTF